jgi:hypothetical protein
MSGSYSQRRPSEEELLAVLNHSEPIVVALRGHQFVETVLNAAIAEALPEPHALEVSRIGCALKIDLGVALGLISPDGRAGYQKVNTVRNRFAHDARTKWGEAEAADLYDSLSSSMRQALGERSDLGTPIQVLGRCVGILYTWLEASVTAQRDQKVRERELGRMVEDKLRDVETRYELPSESPRARVIEGKVTEERERRFAAGDL